MARGTPEGAEYDLIIALMIDLNPESPCDFFCKAIKTKLECDPDE